MKSSVLHWRSWATASLLLPALLGGCAETPGRAQPLGYVVSTAYSPDGRYLAASTSEGEVALFDVQPLWFRRLLSRESDKVQVKSDYIGAAFRPWPVAFSPDGRYLAAAGASGNLVVWDLVADTEKIRTRVDGRIVDLAFFPDGQTLGSVGPDVILRSVCDSGHMRKVKVDLPAGMNATAVAVSPDGRVLAVGTANGEIAMFDALNLKLLRITKEHEAPVTGLAFQQQGETFASTAGGYDLRLWKRMAEGGFEKDASPVAAPANAAETMNQAQGLGTLLWLLGTIRGFQLVGAPTLGAPPISGGADPAFAQAARATPPHCGSRVTFSANGRYLISTANLMKCADCIGTLAPAFLLFATDLETGKTTTVRDLGCEVSASPDGRTFATQGPGAPQIRDSATGQLLPRK
jgi:WD40 repeat protein